MAGGCLVPILFLALFGFHSAHGSYCMCPTFFHRSDQSYCCPTESDYTCCTADEYYSHIFMVFIIMMIPLLIIICIITCICAACRIILRRSGPKSTGTVYPQPPFPPQSYTPNVLHT